MKEEIINEEFGLSSGDTIVVKVGSNILAGDNKGVNIENMQNIIDGIDYLMGIGLNVILVSSGAVAVGKNISGLENEKNLSIVEKAAMATRGQAKLIDFYTKLIEEKNNIKGITQELVDNTIFKEKEKKDNFSEILKFNFKDRYLNILNENDAINREELKFSDNDKLAGLVAKTVKAKVLVLVSNIDGIYKNYGKQNQELIEKVDNIDEVRKYCEDTKSSAGTGGMKSKLDVMEKMIHNQINGILTNGEQKNILQNIFEGKKCNKTIFKV